MPPRTPPADPADALTTEMAQISALIGGRHPAWADDDLRNAAVGILPLLPVAASPEAWAWDLEPATRFDPNLAFVVAPPTAWPPPEAPPVSAVPSAGARRRAPGTGHLEADLAAVADGSTDAGTLAAAYRARIAARNPELAAFITVCAADDPQASASPHGGPTPLLGACLAIKDIVETAGLRTTGGSAQREHHLSLRDAACWQRLRAAGALCLGKTNTHEFAAGTTNENERFGAARNPYDTTRITGGSSGGSAAAVAAGLASAAIGSDTGGSIRIPAACCGVVGLKPTYGRISRAGVYALAWSLDHVGPLAASVRDAALLFGAMAGADPADPSTTHQPPLPDAAGLGLPRPGGLRGLRIGVPCAWLEEAGSTAAATGGIATAPGVRESFEGALRTCQALGAQVLPIDLSSADLATAVNRLIALPESAAWHAPHLRTTPGRYGRIVRGRLLAGLYVTAEAYLQAQRLRTRLGRRYAAVLTGARGVHLVATPTLPTVAPAIGAEPAEGLALLRFCAPFNVVGWPALTLPCGRSPAGLAYGLQLAAAPWREEGLLAAAATVEEALAESR